MSLNGRKRKFSVEPAAESRRSAREWGQGNGAIVAWDASIEGKTRTLNKK